MTITITVLRIAFTKELKIIHGNRGTRPLSPVNSGDQQ
jgi:hypothetical protein